MSFRIIAAFVIFLFSMRVNAQTVMPSEPLSKVLTIFELPPFERAVCCIRYYEGLHRKKDYPYVGYGHRLQPGERYSSEMTASEAEALLRKDLKELCSLFRPYGKDSLLLSEISDNSRERSQIHYGTARLRYKEKDKTLEGTYWTDRKSVGDIILTKLQ